MQDRYFLRLLTPFVALLLVLAGCDSGVAPTEAEQGSSATTVQFSASSTAVTEADSLAEVDVSISNPDGQSVTVEVIFAAASSSANLDDLNLSADGIPSLGDGNAYVVGSVTFDGSAEDGATETLTFDVTDEDDLEERETAVFALQNVQTSGSASIGSPSSFDLSIGFPPISDIRTRSLGENATIQGTITRIDRGTAFMQDESGGIALFDDDFAGTVSPGDDVIVSGALTVFAGLLELEDVSGTVVSSDNPLPEPTTATLAELAENGEALEATLVRVEDLSFDESGTFSGGTNYTITDGSGGAVQLRVPSQSFYVGQPIPSDPVTFEGILSQFNGAFDSIEPNTGYQLLAISEGDLSSVGDGGGGGGPQLVTINEARQSLDQEVVIEGTVTRAFGAYARVQDDSGPTGASGLVIRQTSGSNSDAFQGDIESGSIQPGTTVQLTGTVTEFNGVVQINGGDLTSYEVLSQGSVPSAQSVTLADLESGGEDYESELVEVTDLTFPSATGTFENGTSYDVTDGSTTLTFRVQNADETALAGTSIPTEAFTYTGVVGEFNGTYQLIPIRPTDLETSGGGGDGTSTINEARQDVGSTVTIEGTVSRAFGDFARIQDDSGPTGASGLVIRQTGGAFYDDVQSGTIAAGTTLRITGTTSEFNGIIQINEDDLSSYEVVSQGDAPTPQTPSLADLDTNGEDYESELVEIENLTFPDASGTFSTGTSYTVEDGNGNQLTFRVQSGSETDLGGVDIPSGTFTYTGVVGEFNGSYQLIPVLPSDIGATDGGGGDTPEPITIEEARALEDDEPVVFEAILTRGQGRYLFFQDETAGLQLFDFGGFNDELDAGELAIGDRVRVSGVMGTFNEQRQVTDAELEVLSSGNELPAVQTITLDELNQNGDEYIHELVRVENFTIDAGGDDVFQAGGADGNYDIDDGTATSVLRLEGSDSSEYEGEPIPSGEVTFEGAVTQYQGTYQLHLALESDLITE